jgi:hypothetical protein
MKTKPVFAWNIEWTSGCEHKQPMIHLRIGEKFRNTATDFFFTIRDAATLSEQLATVVHHVCREMRTEKFIKRRGKKRGRHLKLIKGRADETK